MRANFPSSWERTFSIIFKGLSFTKNCLRLESGSLCYHICLMRVQLIATLNLLPEVFIFESIPYLIVKNDYWLTLDMWSSWKKLKKKMFHISNPIEKFHLYFSGYREYGTSSHMKFFCYEKDALKVFFQLCYTKHV